MAHVSEEEYYGNATAGTSTSKKVGKHNNTLPIWGNENSMNLNPLILANIQGSSYFKVHLFKLKTYHEVVDEIYYQVKHMEPWERGSRKTSGQTGMCGGVRGVGAGGIVSTAYCLLYKLYTLRLTRKQVNGLLNHTDSPYIRALGFMYLRYTQPPADLYDWYEDYLLDEEEIDVKAGGGQVLRMGQMVYQFLTKLDWFSTLFPRIPVPIQKQIEKKIEQFCRENQITLHQLTSSRMNAAPVNAAAAAGAPAFEETDCRRGLGGAGAAAVAVGGPDRRELHFGGRAPASSYRSEHDERDHYRERAYRASSSGNGHSEYRDDSHGSREREHKHREHKHKKKHKHKRSRSQSRSRSRSHSRGRTEPKRDRDYYRERDRDRGRERTGDRERDYYDERRYR